MDDKPNQPGNFKFPKRCPGQKNPELRAFNPQWFTQRPWLHYDEQFTDCAVEKLVVVETPMEKQANGSFETMDDTRPHFVVSMFGFLKDGTLTVNVTKFSVSLRPGPDLGNQTFGFTLVMSSSTGAANYMEDYRDKCILQDNKDISGDKGVISIVFFRMNFYNNTIMIERRGEAVKNLVIRGESHEVNRRATEPHLDSPISDNSLFQNTKNKVLRIRRDEEDEKLKAKETDTGDDKKEHTEDGETDDKDKTVTADEENKEQTGADSEKKNKTESDPGKEEMAQSSPDTPEPIITQLPFNKSNKSSEYKTYFEVKIGDYAQEGMYFLSFHNCHNFDSKKQEAAVNITVDVIEDNNGNYLSAGEIPIPALFFALCIVYFIAGMVWLTVLRKSTECVYKMHYLMLAVILVKSVACLFHAMNSHFIQKKGIHEEAWAVLYYIAYLMRGALLFITVILIGSGWAFIKHVLSDKEKKLFLIVIPLQILDNIAWIIMEESEEGQTEHTKWKEIFILVDLLCCGAILFPVVWSIRHLTEAAAADGKAALSLNKLKLFRQFYIMVVCYIYFTRIIVYLLWMTVPFRYEWLNDMFKEIGTLVFFVVTGYKFRPASDNPYLQVPVESDEEDIEMDEVITRSGAYDSVHRVNQSHKEDGNSVKVRESSHEYD